MKNIILKQLELTNYRNIKHAIYDFDGNSKIVGENRIGKTNTLESIYYLLTDSLLGGSNDIAEIKPRDDTKATVRISAIFEIDGKEIEIGKEYQENWVKNRGTQELILKGHDTNYLFNGVKQSTIKEYNRLVAEEFGITTNDYDKVNIFKMLIDPFYIGNLGEDKDWTSLRSFIISLVGDVQDEDVFTAKPILNDIKNDLIKVSGHIDQLKKQFKQNIDELNDKLIGLDAQIKMLEETPDATDEELAIARKEKEEIEAKINELKNSHGEDVASKQIQDEIQKLSIQIFQQREAETQKFALNPALNKKNTLLREQASKQQELNAVIQNRSKLLDDISFNEREQSSLVYAIEDCTKKRENLLTQLKEIDGQISNVDDFIQSTCPTCHRPLEADKIDELKKSFVETKTAEMTSLIAIGKANKELKEKSEVELAQLKVKHDEYESQIKELDDSRYKLNDEIKSLQPQIDDFIEPVQVDSEKLTDLKAKKSTLEQNLIESRKTFENGGNTLNQAIYDLQSSEEPYIKIIDKHKYWEMNQDKLISVKDEKEKTTKKLIEAEQKTELVKTFIYTKLKMLDENVSKVFGNIKFQLIKENINGGFDTICKPYIFNIDANESTNVTWKSGSKSEKVITGIAIMECIKTKLSLPNLPYLFDEGGEISTDTFNTKFKTNSQIICVKVQDNIQKPMVVKI